jgi:hypothetical protein
MQFCCTVRSVAQVAVTVLVVHSQQEARCVLQCLVLPATQCNCYNSDYASSITTLARTCCALAASLTPQQLLPSITAAAAHTLQQ